MWCQSVKHTHTHTHTHVTCTNTFGSRHVTNSAVNTGDAACAAEQYKRLRYALLSLRYRFQPLAVESAGPTVPQDPAGPGKMDHAETGEPQETCWLRQRVSLAAVRDNAAAITKHPQTLAPDAPYTHTHTHTQTHTRLYLPCPSRLNVIAACGTAGAGCHHPQ